MIYAGFITNMMDVSVSIVQSGDDHTRHIQWLCDQWIQCHGQTIHLCGIMSVLPTLAIVLSLLPSSPCLWHGCNARTTVVGWHHHWGHPLQSVSHGQSQYAWILSHVGTDYTYLLCPEQLVFDVLGAFAPPPDGDVYPMYCLTSSLGPPLYPRFSLKPIQHQFVCLWAYVYPDPLSAQHFCSRAGDGATTEQIKHDTT